MSSSNLLRFRKKQKYIYFDYETCNLNLNSIHNKPWQLGFIIAENSKILNKFEFYIDWENLKVSKDAAAITGFSKSKYNKLKKPAIESLKLFNKYLYDPNYLVIGHNILGFDVYIHNIHMELCGFKTDYSYLDRVYDTHCLARAIKNGIESPKESHLSWQYKLLNFRVKGVKTNLKEMCKTYKIDFDEKKLHDALYDVEKTHEVFNKIIWNLEI